MLEIFAEENVLICPPHPLNNTHVWLHLKTIFSGLIQQKYAVLRPNKIWGHKFLTGMISMVCKKYQSLLFSFNLLPTSLKST